VAQRVEDLTVSYEEDGRPVVQELDKEILSKGAWATVLFRYRQMDNKTGELGEEKYVIRRYRKMGGEYKPQSKFNISSKKQARHIVDALSRWIAEADED
jgi:hypothetical protein